MPSKLRPKLNLPSDNSDLRHSPSQQQVTSVYAFCQSFHQYQCDFIMLSYNLAPHAAISSLQLVDTSEPFALLIEEIAINGYVLVDTLCDRMVNYKGAVGWILLAFNNKGFVVDGLALHRQLNQLKKIIESPKITKFCYRLGNFLQDAKRDWNAFGMNFFDFQLLQKSMGIKKSCTTFSHVLSERPIHSQALSQLQQRYDTMIRYMHQIRYFLERQQGQDYSIYSYSNHYEILLTEYQHKASSLAEQQKEYAILQNEIKKRLKENKENNAYYNQADQTGSDKIGLAIENDKQRFLCGLMIQWREHMAKIIDCPPKQIITFQQILIIAIENRKSILQIQQTLQDLSLCSFQKASNILELLAFAAEQSENLMNELQIRSKKTKEDKNIKNLLSQLKWQGRDEWLNRNNDQSIRLYKEIVSIVELDSSIVEQFKTGMSKGVVGNSQIGRFVKYAEYFRNCNHRKLKQYYDSNFLLESNFDNEQEVGWESEQEQVFITPKIVIASQTSIASSSEKILDKMDNFTNHTLPTARSPSSINSIIDLDMSSNKVEPLPENIEQIYLKAVSVKKNYQKIQKKKTGRKQGKEQFEQFVPSWQQIKMLLQA